MANASKTLGGFEVIDDIKKEIEKECPRTVSCADILTAATRDATRMVNGGTYWTVEYGRKDGMYSYAKEADELVPTGYESITTLLQLFQSMGLDVSDLVILSGKILLNMSKSNTICINEIIEVYYVFQEHIQLEDHHAVRFKTGSTTSTDMENRMNRLTKNT